MDQRKTVLDKFEHFMNELSDMDMGWYPFLFLRPAPDKYMDNWVVGKIGIYGGVILGIFYTLLLLALGYRFSIGTALLMTAGCIVFFFIFYRFTFALAWNRRTARIVTTKQKREGKAF